MPTRGVLVVVPMWFEFGSTCIDSLALGVVFVEAHSLLAIFYSYAFTPLSGSTFGVPPSV